MCERAEVSCHLVLTLVWSWPVGCSWPLIDRSAFKTMAESLWGDIWYSNFTTRGLIGEDANSRASRFPKPESASTHFYRPHKIDSMKLVFALSLLTTAAASCKSNLDFNGFAAGTIMSNQYPGVTISGKPKLPMIFDTANPTGGDTDLATSNLGKCVVLSQISCSLVAQQAKY